MGKSGFFFNLEKCIGCKACQVACKDKNNIEQGVFFRRAATCSVINGEENILYNYSYSCNHCSKPSCVEACPVGAMHKEHDGTVNYDTGKCIGCGSCVWSCPYGAPQFSKTHGASRKCNLCYELRCAGKRPVCVEACPTYALDFGELDEFQARYGFGLSSQVPFINASTQPSILIKGIENKIGASCNSEYTHISDTAEIQSNRETKRNDTRNNYLLLGGGIAAVSAAVAIRERDKTANITIVSEEAYLPYSRTMLTKASLRGFDIDKHLIMDESWYRENHINCLLNHKIHSIEQGNKRVLLENGESLEYDKCVYALGADSFVPPIAGVDKDGIISIRQSSDIDKVRSEALTAKNATAIGGGVIGLEMAWELHKTGIQVVVVELARTLMDRILNEPVSKFLEKQFTKLGIQIITDAGIDYISGSNKSEGLQLRNGEFIPSDVIILSTGIKPNVQIAKTAELEIGRSVKVNEYMQTSSADIYACGDCAEIEGYNPGTWTNSKAQGYIAGANAAGDTLAYKAEPSSILINAADTCMFSIGDMGKNPDKIYRTYTYYPCYAESSLLVNPRSNNECIESYCVSDGVLVGASLIGNLSKASMLKSAVIHGVEFDKLSLYKDDDTFPVNTH